MLRTLLLGFLLLSLVCGCGRTYTVKGKVTRGGKAIEWTSDETLLLVLFAPVDRVNNPAMFRAETDSAAGTYVIKAIPSGKYLVSIQLMDPRPLTDALNFAYGLNNSPLEYHVQGDGEYNIDLPLRVPRGAKGPDRRDKTPKEQDK